MHIYFVILIDINTLLLSFSGTNLSVDHKRISVSGIYRSEILFFQFLNLFQGQDLLENISIRISERFKFAGRGGNTTNESRQIVCEPALCSFGLMCRLS